MTRPRTILSVTTLLLFFTGAFLSSGPARLTLLNAGLRVDYPWPRAVGAWVALLGAVGAAVVFRRLWARVILVCVAVLTLYAALHLTLFRFEANDTGVNLRGVLGTDRLAWAEVRKVDPAPGLRVLLGPGDRRIGVDTTDLLPTDAAALDRTIARRLTETSKR